jgi:hypothetical protein
MVRTLVLWVTKIIGGLRDIPEDIEEELKNHILKLEERMFRITPLELRSLAYQVVERNCVPHRFNKDKKKNCRKEVVLYLHKKAPRT